MSSATGAIPMTRQSGVATLADGVIIGIALIDAVTQAATPDDACAAAHALISAAR
jgi:hypothetical protein